MTFQQVKKIIVLKYYNVSDFSAKCLNGGKQILLKSECSDTPETQRSMWNEINSTLCENKLNGETSTTPETTN